MTVQELTRDRADDLAGLLRGAMPDEVLSGDELLACCWDDPERDGPGEPVGVVLAIGHDPGEGEGEGEGEGDGPGLAGAVSAVCRTIGDPGAGVRLAWVKLVAVDPAHRRRGIGHELMAAIEAWAWANGAAEVHLAGSPPFYLWPGVDATATEMLCLVESRGYRDIGSDVNMALGTAFRAEPPIGIEVRRAVADGDAALVDDLVGRHWPEWLDETRRAIEHGCCHGAFTGDDHPDGARAVGFACHSVSRAGWLGPMGTDPDRRQGGVGSALVGQVCRDLQIADFDTTEICWVGPARFYAKNGATVSRVFRRYRLRRPDR